MIARSQLIGMGLSPRTVDGLSAPWPRLARGVYLVSSSFVEPSWTARVWGGVLLGGRGARAGGRAAAALDGLADWSELKEVTILVPERKISRHPGYYFVRERPGVRLSSTSREPARTRIEDTVLDLCAGATSTEVVTWLTRACQRRLTNPERIRRRLQARSTLRRRALVLEILEDVQAGATSHLEHRALTEVIRPHGLPITRLQHRVGSRGRIVDAAVAEFGVLIEFDGRIGHVEEGAFRDRGRDNAHTLEGWVTLRFGWTEVTGDPCSVAAETAALLGLRGWTGALVRCPRCPPGLFG